MNCIVCGNELARSKCACCNKPYHRRCGNTVMIDCVNYHVCGFCSKAELIVKLDKRVKPSLMMHMITG